MPVNVLGRTPSCEEGDDVAAELGYIRPHVWVLNPRGGGSSPSRVVWLPTWWENYPGITKRPPSVGRTRTPQTWGWRPHSWTVRPTSGAESRVILKHSDCDEPSCNRDNSRSMHWTSCPPVWVTFGMFYYIWCNSLHGNCELYLVNVFVAEPHGWGKLLLRHPTRLGRDVAYDVVVILHMLWCILLQSPSSPSCWERGARLWLVLTLLWLWMKKKQTCFGK